MTCRITGAGAAGNPICHRLLNLQQAAEVADVPVERICDWVVARKLGAYRLIGGLRIDEIELGDFLSSRGRRSDPGSRR